MNCQLKILDFNGCNYDLDVNDEDIVRDLKIKIRDLGGPHITSQKIIYRGKELNDDEKISIYTKIEFPKTNIKHMMLDQDETIKFNVHLKDGRTFDVNYNVKKDGNTVLGLKIHLLKILHVLVSNIILSIDGKILNNDQKVTFIDNKNNLFLSIISPK